MLLIRNYIALKAQQITICSANNSPTGVEHLKRQLDNLRALFLRTKKFNKIFIKTSDTFFGLEIRLYFYDSQRVNRIKKGNIQLCTFP